ncbi:hypothetical protein VIGAN_05259500 [Vigna angularis var. angularis]|uniref:Uncharacterized protein n=1 Tax=Vigna angularis var. angularis TaxID=157739 RepID=A0A0S3S7X4_PHAAN|nr:hypothetical protein VIGAN_05259500 [Vigna angularis var. angularis]
MKKPYETSNAEFYFSKWCHGPPGKSFGLKCIFSLTLGTLPFQAYTTYASTTLKDSKLTVSFERHSAAISHLFFISRTKEKGDGVHVEGKNSAVTTLEEERETSIKEDHPASWREDHNMHKSAATLGSPPHPAATQHLKKNYSSKELLLVEIASIAIQLE